MIEKVYGSLTFMTKKARINLKIPAFIMKDSQLTELLRFIEQVLIANEDIDLINSFIERLNIIIHYHEKNREE